MAVLAAIAVVEFALACVLVSLIGVLLTKKARTTQQVVVACVGTTTCASVERRDVHLRLTELPFRTKIPLRSVLSEKFFLFWGLFGISS